MRPWMRTWVKKAKNEKTGLRQAGARVGCLEQSLAVCQIHRIRHLVQDLQQTHIEHHVMQLARLPLQRTSLFFSAPLVPCKVNV